jgi:hypothetical protein
MGVGKTLLSDAIEKEVALTLTCSAVLVYTGAVSYVATIEGHRESNEYGYDDRSQCHDIQIKNYIKLNGASAFYTSQNMLLLPSIKKSIMVVCTANYIKPFFQ